MKKRADLYVIFVLLLTGIFICPSVASAADLMVADFESGLRNNLGGEIGAWGPLISNLPNSTNGCDISIVPLYGVVGKGTDESSVLKVHYDLANTGVHFGGVWFDLNRVNLDRYDELSMLVKGDDESGFTTQFKVEIKNSKGENAIYIVNGITSEWSKIAIPIRALRAANVGSVSDWSQMLELDFTFDDFIVTKKEGILYINDVMFSSKSK